MNTTLLAAVCGVACLSLGAVVGGVVAQAQTVPTPEIDRANATMQLSGTLKSRGCVGEDQTDYVTYTGSWKGGETQMLPDPTEYPLTGALTVNAIQWTIKTKTGRGVLTGKITLINSTSPTPSYSGKLILVTQGNPATGGNVPGRGWINAPNLQPDEGITPGDDSLIANVEFSINAGGAVGQFGDAPGSLGIPDFSAETNVAPRALDGVC
jgi:hypothetical protein